MKGRGRRGLKNYQAALRAIKAKHKGATHRDAQAVYRKLVKLTGGKVTPRQVATARPATTRKLLRLARRQGSRTTPRTKAEKQKQARLAKQFVKKQRQNKRRRGEQKRPKTRKTKTPRRFVGGSSTGAAAGQEAEAPGGASSSGGSSAGAINEALDDADAFDDFVDTYDGEFEDGGEVDSSADYALGET